MCRNIKPLFNFTPKAKEADIYAAAYQYVKKISGFTKPSQANTAAIEASAKDVAAATAKLLQNLKTDAPAKSRQEWEQKRKQMQQERFGR